MLVFLDQKNKDTTLENTQDEKHKETHHKLSLKRSSTTDLTSQQKETVKAKLVRHLCFSLGFVNSKHLSRVRQKY